MTKNNGYSLNEFGSALLIQAINNASKEARDEIAEELEQLRENLT